VRMLSGFSPRLSILLLSKSLYLRAIVVEMSTGSFGSVMWTEARQKRVSWPDGRDCLRREDTAAKTWAARLWGANVSVWAKSGKWTLLLTRL